MIVVKRGTNTFYVKEESITWENGINLSSFNVYALQNRKRFKDIKKAILESSKDELLTMDDVIALSMKIGLYSQGTSIKPAVSDEDIFL